MKDSNLKTVLIVLGAGLCLAVAFVLSRPKTSVTTAAVGPIDGYKRWTRVNPEPKLVPSQTAALCAPASVAVSQTDLVSPHRDKYVTVYVNDIGRPAMQEQLKPVFPEGSIVVKEKLTAKESSTPELLTVMRKRERGYDPEHGDWEYLVFDGDGKTMKESGKLQKCQECHAREKATDYVSRDYMPVDIWKKLK